MIRLEDLQLFVRAAALSSFSEAAREADLLPGQVSAAIKRLEAALDLRLFARSTRSLRLTPEGERYLPFAQTALDALREGREQLLEDRSELRGALHISMPSDLGRHVLLPWLTEFRRQHPQLRLRLSFVDRIADVFRESVDVAIRYGEIEDASFVALPLAPWNQRVLCAAPDLLTRSGGVRTLDDVARHDCLVYALSGRMHDKWTFNEAGQRRVVHVRGVLQSDDGEVVRRLAVAGEGLAYKSWLDVADDLRSGRLVAPLPQLAGELSPLNLVCPHRRQFSPAVQQLHRWLRQRFDVLREASPWQAGEDQLAKRSSR
ncbi:MAG: LysR family transcriptional regulator [Burkholderiaceae bacterium]|nr:LysR family transcriptional regulator [Roseateles sp.]MBV8468527.1 LysR family transcriptional regulator [Burkholderiaceae bacterium]